MGTSRKSFDSLGRASNVQQDQVNPPKTNRQNGKTQSTPANQPYASSHSGRGQQPPRGDKGQPITEPDYRPMKGPTEGLVEDTGQEDPGSQIDKQ